MRRTVWLIVPVAVLLATGLVLGNAVVVFVNGVRTTDVIVSKGKVYISTDALKRAGAEVVSRCMSGLTRPPPAPVTEGSNPGSAYLR
jgi:hypothetical protein